MNEQRATTGWAAEWDAKSKLGLSVVRAELIEATARIPGVLDDLAAFVARAEAIRGTVYAGLVRNASFREEQLCSLSYLNTMDSGALELVRFWSVGPRIFWTASRWFAPRLPGASVQSSAPPSPSEQLRL
jgi:hypothetical protein